MKITACIQVESVFGTFLLTSQEAEELAAFIGGAKPKGAAKPKRVAHTPAPPPEPDAGSRGAAIARIIELAAEGRAPLDIAEYLELDRAWTAEVVASNQRRIEMCAGFGDEMRKRYLAGIAMGVNDGRAPRVEVPKAEPNGKATAAVAVAVKAPFRCARCKKERRHCARGLCNSCYCGESKRGTIDRWAKP